MILLVSMTKPGDDYSQNGAGAWGNKLKFEEISGHPCLIQHYSEVTPQSCKDIGARAIFISGFGYGWDEILLKRILGLYDVVKSLEYPVLGACGGHQLLGHIFTKDFRKNPKLADEPMRKLRPGEPDWDPDYHPGWFVEKGMHPVEMVKRDPIFKGFRKRMWMREAHYCEVKKLPPDFELLATNENCKIQAMHHKEAIIYGTQFHPEAYTDAYQDGKKLLTNFFAIAGLTR